MNARQYIAGDQNSNRIDDDSNENMHIVLVILIIILFILSVSIVGFSLHTGISPMPSSSKAKKAILSVIPQDSHTIYELGSGWGGLALALAKALPLAQLHAFELSPLPWIISTLVQKIVRRSTLNIYKKNFFLHPLEGADVVVCYLYPKAMQKLKSKFEKELRPGTWVISNSFAIPGWAPVKVVQLNDIWKSEIFVYISGRS